MDLIRITNRTDVKTRTMHTTLTHPVTHSLTHSLTHSPSSFCQAQRPWKSNAIAPTRPPKDDQRRPYDIVTLEWINGEGTAGG